MVLTSSSQTRLIGLATVTSKLFFIFGLSLISSISWGAIFGAIQSMGVKQTYLLLSQPLPTNQMIRVQTNSANDKLQCCATLRSKDFIRSKKAEDSEDLFRYKFTGKKQTFALMGAYVGIAVVGNHTAVHQLADDTLVVNEKHETYQVFQCTSQEGAHVIARNKSKLVSDTYIYAGYDTEVTCNDSDFQ